MSGTTKDLAPKLESVLLRLCENVPEALTITGAVKLPYLVDVIAVRVLGRTISGGSHEAWDHGVVTSEAWRHLRRQEGRGGPFEVKEVPFSEEIRVRARGEVPAESTLTYEEQRIVDFVADEYAGLSATDLGRLTKSMNPEIARWGSNHRADISLNAYERMSPEYLDMAETVEGVTLDHLRRNARSISSPEQVLE